MFLISSVLFFFKVFLNYFPVFYRVVLRASADGRCAVSFLSQLAAVWAQDDVRGDGSSGLRDAVRRVPVRVPRQEVLVF